MNEQQIFDAVATHLLAQKKRASSHGYCQFRTEDGLKCAVGCLIPDEAYHPGLEEKQLESVVEAALPWDVTADQYHLLRALQTVHDQ